MAQNKPLAKSFEIKELPQCNNFSFCTRSKHLFNSKEQHLFSSPLFQWFCLPLVQFSGFQGQNHSQKGPLQLPSSFWLQEMHANLNDIHAVAKFCQFSQHVLLWFNDWTKSTCSGFKGQICSQWAPLQCCQAFLCSKRLNKQLTQKVDFFTNDTGPACNGGGLLSDEPLKFTLFSL